MKIGIIGAGMAGLSCADALAAQGHAVRLFDKGRGPGGRMSTRRMDTPLGEVLFDHGAQYFTVRNPGFAALARGWADRGLALRWPQAGRDAWIGVPGMSALIRDMAFRHDVTFGRLVKGIVRDLAGWHFLMDEGRAGPFDVAVIAIPAEQAAALLSLHDFAMARIALKAVSLPCWTAMFVFDRPVDGACGLLRDVGDLAWAVRNGDKPGRSGPEGWVVQASAEWSVDHLEHAGDDIATRLHGVLAALVGTDLPAPAAASAHRWRYALSAGTGDEALWNDALGLAACGDWLHGPRVECAWLSGVAAARHILESAITRA